MVRVAVIDSGVGGLAVHQLVLETVPQASTLYLADHAFAPYGPRSAAELVDRLTELIQRLRQQPLDLVLLACNTATVTSITALRERFPGLPFVGMEPAVKPAANTVDRFIVMGTQCTVTNERYRRLCESEAAGKQVWHVAAPQLVEQVERGDLETTEVLERLLGPAIDEGAQGLVIGCTHFSFLVPALQRTWPGLQIFDGRFGTVKRVES
ncbi:MAG TPA: glutamate racemase, partial [Candidatus Xenobia bacterium]